MLLQNHVPGTRLVSNLPPQALICFVAVYTHQLVPFLHAIPLRGWDSQGFTPAAAIYSVDVW
jgi:hypothetical protein